MNKKQIHIKKNKIWFNNSKKKKINKNRIYFYQKFLDKGITYIYKYISKTLYTVKIYIKNKKREL